MIEIVCCSYATIFFICFHKPHFYISKYLSILVYIMLGIKSFDLHAIHFRILTIDKCFKLFCRYYSLKIASLLGFGAKIRASRLRFRAGRFSLITTGSLWFPLQNRAVKQFLNYKICPKSLKVWKAPQQIKLLRFQQWKISRLYKLRPHF